MEASAESEQTAIAGFHPVHLVAQSYLGSLWVALDKRSGEPGQPVLLRRVQLPALARIEALQRVACAGRDAMALNHDNVLTVLGVAQEGESLAIAYEYVEAEPLRSLQSCASLRGLSFPVGVSVRIIIDLLRGVKALHGALVGWPSVPPFGGLSPDSVLVARDGRTRLSDPLVASCATLLEGTGLSTAKLSYAAPEQVHATAPLGPALDVFTCAAMLWELLAGRRLLSGSRATIERKLLEHDLPKLGAHLRGDQQVSSALVDLVQRSLSLDPGKRPESPGALAIELEQCGQKVASLAQVAQFMGEVSGQRFDPRGAMGLAAAPMTSSVLLEAPASLPPQAGSPRRIVPLPARSSSSSTAAARVPRFSGASISALADSALKNQPARLEPSIAPSFRPIAEHSELDDWSISEPPPPVIAVAAARAVAAAPAVAVPAVIAAPIPAPPVVTAPIAAPPAASSAIAAAPLAARAAISAPRPAVARAASPRAAAPPAVLAAPPAVATPLAAVAVAPLAVTAPVAAPPVVALPLRAAVGVGRGTMVGIGAPPCPAPAAAPMPPVSVAPNPFAATFAGTFPGIAAPSFPAAPAASFAAAPSSATPVPVVTSASTSSPRGVSLTPSAPNLGSLRPNDELMPRVAPSSRARRPSGWSHAPKSGPGTRPRARALLVAGLGMVALGIALAMALLLRPAPNGPELTLAPTSAATRDSNAGLPAPAEPAPVPPGSPDTLAPKTTPSEPAGTVASAPGVAPDAPSVLPPGDFGGAALADDRLIQLFALESRADLPSCAKRSSASRQTRKDPRKSQTELKAARRELVRGNNEKALVLLCSATGHSAANIGAWQTLAELSLHQGDADQAKQAVEQALKRKPKDPTLLGILGDAFAMLGDLKRSRTLWAQSAKVTGSEAERARRLAAAFGANGDRQLRAWSHGGALVYYRRAAVLSAGNHASSVGMGEALRRLGQTRAEAAWVARAASIAPPDARSPILP